MIFSATYYNPFKPSWTISQIDPVYYNVTKVIKILKNPTISTTTMRLSKNTLPYGLIKITYSVSTYTYAPYTPYNGWIDTYLQVNPTGIKVCVFNGCINNKTFGVFQKFTLYPANYSYDIDRLLNMSNLTFKYNCRLVNKSLKFQYYLNFSGEVDLKTAQSTPGFVVNPQQFCFNSTSKIISIRHFITNLFFNEFC
jgi:hypothetical protein